MTGDADAWETARALYALPRADFISARNAEARRLKRSDPDVAAQVAGLGKPSAAADLVNRWVRSRTDLVTEVRDLGSRLRSAQRRSEASRLRELDQGRRELVNRCVDAARSVAEDAGERATEATLRDVEQTVWAAIVDAGAFAALKAGVLVRPMSPGGFGAVDTSASSALPVEAEDEDLAPDPPPAATRRPSGTREAAPRPPTPTRAQQEARRKARHDLEVATDELQAAEGAADDATRIAEEADELVTRLQQERDELRERLTALEQQVRDVARDVKDRQSARRFAERARRAASDRLDRARRAVDRADET